jgi:hypothetical protein
MYRLEFWEIGILPMRFRFDPCKKRTISEDPDENSWSSTDFGIP